MAADKKARTANAKRDKSYNPKQNRHLRYNQKVSLSLLGLWCCLGERAGGLGIQHRLQRYVLHAQTSPLLWPVREAAANEVLLPQTASNNRQTAKAVQFYVSLPSPQLLEKKYSCRQR